MSKTKELIGDIKPGQDVAVFIGPEGGFDPGEIEYIKKLGIPCVTLGKRILRTETASTFVLSSLSYRYELQQNIQR